MNTDLFVWVLVALTIGAVLTAVFYSIGAPRILSGLVVLVTVVAIVLRVCDKMGIYHWHGLSK